MDANDNADIDGKEWVQCENCSKWVHTDCEEQCGIPHLRDLLSNDDTKYKYFCLCCRKKKQLSPKDSNNSSSRLKKENSP